MVQCLSSAKMTMAATLLRQTPDWSGPTDPNFEGEWVDSQDPLTGEIVRVWEPAENIPDDPNTPAYDPSMQTIPCVARGYSASVRYTSNRIFSDDYKNIEVIRLWVPTWVQATKNDRITNVRDANGIVAWVDEFIEDTPQATTFNVVGVTPQFGPFNVHTETILILERAEV